MPDDSASYFHNNSYWTKVKQVHHFNQNDRECLLASGTRYPIHDTRQRIGAGV